MFWEIGLYVPNFSAMYVSQILSQESQTMADYENMNLVRKAKVAKILKTLLSTMDFPQIWCTRLSFDRFSSN